jgi:hypothetical protein
MRTYVRLPPRQRIKATLFRRSCLPLGGILGEIPLLKSIARIWWVQITLESPDGLL